MRIRVLKKQSQLQAGETRPRGRGTREPPSIRDRPASGLAGLSRKTKPIPGGAGRGGACGTRAAGLVQTKPIRPTVPIGRSAFPGEGRACETKPISGRVKCGITTAGEMGYERRYSVYVCEKQSQFAQHRTCGEDEFAGQAPPYMEDVGRDARPSIGSRAGSTKSRLCETKPIPDNRAAGEVSQRSSIPSFQYSSLCVSCETNPICRVRKWAITIVSTRS